ncbi:MAG: efflux RND transporter periplasmic adaptor subunit [Prevotella sp.]|nr:efflux RND transporter periplasmic adaptor subunit [Prevotella sp.]MCM1074216.1 efflux RND transporter periplasmic adaptor subunit [Ruminococcus sp.]
MIYKHLIINLRQFTSAICAAALMMFSSCSAEQHDHDHEAEEHTEHEEEADEHEEASHEGIVVFTEEQARTGGVELTTVSLTPTPGVINCTGQILAAQGDERTITAPLAGEVSFTGQLTPGTKVTAGQRLFNISSAKIVQADPTAALRADLANAQANLARVKEQYVNRLITRAEYDQAVAEVNSARAALANPGIAPVKNATATSPVSGYITSTLVTPGSYVELGAPLATVSGNNHLQLRADVPNALASQISLVTSANIQLPDGSVLSLADLAARIVNYGKMSSDGLYVPVTFEFDNPGSLIGGTPVEVMLLTSETTNTLTVPREAVTEEEGVYFVYIQQSPEHYRKQQVTRGRDNGLNVEITAGLEDGQTIVSKGATLLKLAANSGKAPQGHSHNH